MKKNWYQHYKIQLAISFFLLVGLIAAMRFLSAAETPKTAPTASHSTISEEQLNQLTLSKEAVTKLNITTAIVDTHDGVAYAQYPAQINLPPSGLVGYSTPLTANIFFANQQPLKVGDQVKAGQILLALRPIISPEATLGFVTGLSDAEGQLTAASSQLAASKVTLNRAKQLFEQHVGSQKNVDDAQANVALAQSAFNAAQQKHRLLKKTVSEGSAGNLTIKATQSGVVSNIYFNQGQAVSAGAPLIDIRNQDNYWVNVFVPHGQVEKLNLASEALLSNEDDPSADYRLTPMAVAPLSDLTSGTRQFVFVLRAPSNQIAPLQRVTVKLPLATSITTQLTIPCAAAVVDIYGNEWVYLAQDNNHFERQQVFITQASANECTLSSDQLAGRAIVTNGAQELFSVQTGFTH